MSSDRSERVTLPSRREDASVLSVQFGTAEPIATDVDVGSQVEPTQDPLTTVPDVDESFALCVLDRTWFELRVYYYPGTCTRVSIAPDFVAMIVVYTFSEYIVYRCMSIVLL